MTRIFAVAAVIASALPSHGAAQSRPTLARVLSSEIGISRERAEIQIEFEDGRKLTAAMVDGSAPLRVQGTGTGDQSLVLGVARGGEVDRSWRRLLHRAMDLSPEEIGEFLYGWSAPDAAAAPFESAFHAALRAGAGPGPTGQGIPPAVIDDSVVKLERKIQELEERLRHEQRVERSVHERRGPFWFGPFRRLWTALTQLFGVVLTFAVIFGISFVAILFGARKYIEGVADTVRAGAGRAFLVGLAGAFLVVPVFVLGCIALAISIVGIPALLLWVPVFPLAFGLAIVLGYLAVAHAAGESWAERNVYGSEWFRRGNSYYFIATGLTLLGGLFAAVAILHIVRPWFGWLQAILLVFGIITTIAACITGFGAVLISRGGSRPVTPAGVEQSSLFTEDSNV